MTAGLGGALASTMGCDSPKHFTTTVEVVQVVPFTDDTGALQKLSVELRYAECPGDARRVLQADKSFATCSPRLKTGDKLTAELVSTWQSDRGVYRSEVVRLDDCPMKQDARDEAAYEVVQTCTDVIATGTVVGVRCDRSRSKELVEKCPWLRRK